MMDNDPQGTPKVTFRLQNRVSATQYQCGNETFYSVGELQAALSSIREHNQSTGRGTGIVWRAQRTVVDYFDPDEGLPPVKIYVVQGEHFAVPGVPANAYASRASADAQALDLVNVIRADVGLSPAEGDWEPALKEAQQKRVNEQYDDPEWVATFSDERLIDEAECDVWITEHVLDDARPTT